MYTNDMHESYGDFSRGQDAREGHLLRWLESILLIIFGIGGRFDHVEGVCESSVRARIPLGFV